jgi:hypothetical protein
VAGNSLQLSFHLLVASFLIVGRVCFLGGQASVAGRNTFLWGQVKNCRGRFIHWGRVPLIGASSTAVGAHISVDGKLFLGGSSCFWAEGRVSSLWADFSLWGDPIFIAETSQLYSGRILGSWD